MKLPSHQKSRSPHQASLCACNKAAATFETCAFSLSSSLRLCCGFVQQSRISQKPRRLSCTRATKPRRLSKNAPLFQHGAAAHQTTTERSQKIKLPFQQISRDLTPAPTCGSCCASFPPLPAGAKAHFSVLKSCARAMQVSHRKMRTSGCVLPPGWSQSKRIFCSARARSDKKENKRLCFFPPPTTRSRLDLNQSACLVLRARSGPF